MGNGIFRKIFLPGVSAGEDTDREFALESFCDVDPSEFWGGWMRLLMDRHEEQDQHKQPTLPVHTGGESSLEPSFHGPGQKAYKPITYQMVTKRP